MGCCNGCDEAAANGLVAPCGSSAFAPDASLVAGVTTELAMAKWFLDNRWTLIGASFAAGSIFFATVAYFANRDR